MISAYAKAAIILQCKEYADIAERAVNFINTKLIDKDGRLYVRYRNGEPQTTVIWMIMHSFVMHFYVCMTQPSTPYI